MALYKVIAEVARLHEVTVAADTPKQDERLAHTMASPMAQQGVTETDFPVEVSVRRPRLAS
ncbi:hypothetical protein ACFWXO_30855 [Kitasatospora sp. NPDC059088]|uniref:hypothetical protein n=1 Tax=Kitasatospora sp. NPDC059088 TaxID=3346722 RepID=UPI003691C9BC